MFFVYDLDTGVEFSKSNSAYFEISNEHSAFTTEVFVHKIYICFKDCKACIHHEYSDVYNSVDKLNILRMVKTSYEIMSKLDKEKKLENRDINVNQIAKDCVDKVNMKLIDIVIDPKF